MAGFISGCERIVGYYITLNRTDFSNKYTIYGPRSVEKMALGGPIKYLSFSSRRDILIMNNNFGGMMNANTESHTQRRVDDR